MPESFEKLLPKTPLLLTRVSTLENGKCKKRGRPEGRPYRQLSAVQATRAARRGGRRALAGKYLWNRSK